MQGWLARLADWARRLRRDAIVLYLAARDPRVSWWVRAGAVVVAAYALSPIDLIPDVIPVLGYLDEMILLPVALWALLRLIDPAIIAEHRTAAAAIAERPVSRLGAVLVIAIWIASAVLLIALAREYWSP